ncbi:MAG TPA: hypothetical protein VJV79_21740 [Polyangiaceae bacterium]|nr:hypothetical protein [Polyangiaceae bacterium]
MSTSAPRLSLFLLFSCALFGCADAELAPEQCAVTAPTECLEPELRYANLAPIFEQHCAECHTGKAGGPWPLDDYDSIADWADVMRTELVSCTMPPPGSSNPLRNQDRARILNWLRCGLPE